MIGHWEFRVLSLIDVIKKDMLPELFCAIMIPLERNLFKSWQKLQFKVTHLVQFSAPLLDLPFY